ncbi:MAG: hypothetical protein AABW47_01165 [Nanoarchaeota archaeon]
MKNKKTRDPACITLPLTPRNRSGSHVGMIISFVIFVTFIVFLYGVMKPTIDTGQDKKALLENVQYQLIQKASSNLTIITTQIDSALATEECFQLDNFFVLLTRIDGTIDSPLGGVIPVSLNGYGIVVKNDFGEKQSSYNNILEDGSDVDLRVEREGLGSIVSSVTVSDEGLGYDKEEPPTVTISSPPSEEDTTAKATASVSRSGKVTFVTVTNGGSGYDINNPPTVTIGPPLQGGSTATATAILKANNFFKVYYSPSLEIISQGTTDCSNLLNTEPNPGYTIEAITIDKYIFEKDIQDLMNRYTVGEYEQLKTDLNIPPGTEFEFSFEKSDGNLIEPDPTTIKLKPADVYVEETPVQYVDADANIQSGFIKIAVWE